MKRKQLIAVLLSAVLSMSVCLPSACVSTWAAESTAEGTTEQIQETDMFEGEPPSEGTEERTTAEESASEGTEDLLPAEEPSAEGTEDSSIVEEPTAEEAEDSSIVEEPTAEGAEDSSIVGEPTGEGTEDTSIAEEPLSEGAEDSSSVEEVTENLSATEESVSEDAASDGEGGVSTEDNTQDSATPIAIGSPGIATFTEEARSVSFTFVPETDGDYTFYSISDYDTFAVLMQGDEEITHQFSGGEGENFRFSVFLNAGLEYVLSVGEENDADGNCTVYVEESEDLGGSGEEQENSNLTAWVVGHEEEKGNSSQTLTNWENAGDLEIGSTYTFQVMAETKDNSEPTFQWFQNHKLIEGATSSTFNAVMYQSSINYFICKVSDSQGNQVEISCQISAGGSEEQNYDDNLKAWIVGHDELRDESQQMIYDWGEESLYIGDTVTLQAEVETKDESTPAVWWYKGYFGGNNPIEGANSLTYEALLDHYWTVYTCCIQDDYGNQVTITCCFDVQRMEGNLTAWVDGHESEKGNEVQDICDWETAGKLHVGDTYTIQILTETQDGSEPAFEWYQGSERQLLEEDSSTFEAVMYQEGSNNFTCYITDTRGNQVSISCEFFAYANLRQGAVPITVGTPATATFSDEARWIPFTFTPETDGRYVFYTESNYDTQAYLYNGNDEELGRYDGGGEGENFRFTTRLNAGEEYLLRVSEWSGQNCSCIIHVEQVLPTIVSGMELYGDASLLEDGSVQLTPAHDIKTGTAWLLNPIDTQNGLKTTFSWFAEGEFGEGMTMMFSQEKSLGEGSDRLGFVDGAIGIEFDYGDANYHLDHIAVIQEDAFNHISRKCSEKMSDAQWHQVSVLYKPGYLVVYMDGEEAVHAVGITLPDQVYIGVSAATGNGDKLHKIKDLAVSEGSSDFPDTNGWENEVPASYTITFNATEGYFEEWDEDTENYVHVQTKTETKTEGSCYYVADYTPTAPEGKMFKGWSSTEGGEILDDTWTGRIVTGDTEYFAVWEIPCTITFNATGGFFNEWDEESCQDIQLPSITVSNYKGSRYSLDDYTPWAPGGKFFSGWSLTEGGEILDKWESRVLDQDTTYFAVWEDGCTVTFDAGANGYFRANEHMDENFNDVYDKVQFETHFMRKNIPFDNWIATPVESTEKKFMGWSLTEGGPRIPDEYLVTGDMTVYAVWADPCTVTFNAGQYGYFEEYKWNEETQMDETVRVSTRTEIIGEGGLLIREDRPSPDGKEDGSKLFVGWSFTDDGKMTGEDEYEVTGDITLYAVWGDPCEVTWDANGGHYTEFISDHDYEHEVDFSSYTRKAGKGATVHFEYENPYPPDEASELVGWALSPTGDPITSRTYTITEDITFYAIWSNGTSPAVKEITDENVIVATDALVYNGEEQKPAVTVTLDGSTLAEGIGYSVEYSNNINAGNDTAVVKVIAKGDYTGEVTKTFSIAKANQTITASNLSLTFPNKGKITASGNKGVLTYTSSNTNIATVDTSGNVTAKEAGTAKITIKAAATANYKETSKEITVTVAKANQTITASNLSLTFPNKGKITATASGKGSTLSYTSSKTSVATVDSSGNVTAKGAGSATITIKAAATANYNAASKQITVTVAKAAQSITTKAKASSVAVGKTVAVTTTGAKGTVTYKTSDTGIATVNASTGVVTAKKVGTVKITATAAATANYNAASKTVTIKVVPAATTSLKAENLARGIKVTWAKVTGANGYDIYRNNSKVKTITSGTTVTWTDTAANTNNTKYVYKVVAKASTGASTLSKSLTTYKVTAPTNRSAVNTATRKAVLTWSRNASASGYQVQYSLTSSFSGAKTVTITKNATLTTTVSSLTKGKTYYTRIRAYKTVGSTKYYSNWSASRSVKISK